MNPPLRVIPRNRLLALLAVLLAAGFLATSLSSYEVSHQAIRNAIISQELPLTSTTIYSEIQKDLVRPILISSTMANDTFLRDWLLGGEKDVTAIAHYLTEIKERYGAFSSFLVSERSGRYYTGAGILKRIDATEPRDAWYSRVRQLTEPYEINVDPDLANRDALTIFINYRVLDFNGRFIGATGIGLTVDAVRHLITEYQSRFQRTIYFVDRHGRLVLFGNSSNRRPTDLHTAPGLGEQIDVILARKSGSYEYQADDTNYLLNVNYIPELKWYLFVEKAETAAMAEIRRTLLINLAIWLLVTVVVVGLAYVILSRYQSRIEEMATIDKLSGLLNRHAFDVLAEQFLAERRRSGRPLSILLIDIDRFKTINDRFGHHVGDRVLCEVARRLRNELRQSDIAVRWGGDELLILLKDCDAPTAATVAEKLRTCIADHPFATTETPLDLSVSIGVAEHRPDEACDQTIARADTALYEAKSLGRNRVGVTTTTTEGA